MTILALFTKNQITNRAESEIRELWFLFCSRKVRHPVELADLLYALSRDERYQLICEELSEKDTKGEIRMCELLDIVEKNGQAKLNTLIRKLAAEERYEDLVRSAADNEYQKKLMREYQIIWLDKNGYKFFSLTQTLINVIMC